VCKVRPLSIWAVVWFLVFLDKYICEASVNQNTYLQGYFPEKGNKVKVKLPLCLTKYYAMKTHSLLNQALYHEDVLGEWRYSSTHS